MLEDNYEKDIFQKKKMTIKEKLGMTEYVCLREGSTHLQQICKRKCSMIYVEGLKAKLPLIINIILFL